MHLTNINKSENFTKHKWIILKAVLIIRCNVFTINHSKGEDLLQ